jgi:hypothetical protein
MATGHYTSGLWALPNEGWPGRHHDLGLHSLLFLRSIRTRKLEGTPLAGVMTVRWYRHEQTGASGLDGGMSPPMRWNGDEECTVLQSFQT